MGFQKPKIHTTCYLKFRSQVDSSGTQGNFCFIIKTEKIFVKIVIKTDFPPFPYLLPTEAPTSKILNKKKKITLKIKLFELLQNVSSFLGTGARMSWGMAS